MHLTEIVFEDGRWIELAYPPSELHEAPAEGGIYEVEDKYLVSAL
jgi:hypothetical protein